MKTNWQAREVRIHNLRMATQARHLSRIERLETKADLMVGELSSGKFYVFPVGGKYFESNSHTSVVDYLIRNKYVR